MTRMSVASSISLNAENLRLGVTRTAPAKPQMFEANQCLANRALTALHGSTLVPDRRITVSVEHGAVTLAGTVNWQFQRAAATRCICGLTYDGPLFNKITVKPLPTWTDLMVRT